MPEGLGLSPEEMGLKPEDMEIEQPKQTEEPKGEFVSAQEVQRHNEEMHYHEEGEVNGIQIEVRAAQGRYEIYFPQINASSERARQLNIMDQIIPLTDDKEEAKKAFRTAMQQSMHASDVYEAYASTYSMVF